MVEKKSRNIFNEIALCTKQYYEVGKVSKNLRTCAEMAVEQCVGLKELSVMCSIFGIVKKDYIDKIVIEVEKMIKEEKNNIIRIR